MHVAFRRSPHDIVEIEEEMHFLIQLWSFRVFSSRKWQEMLFIPAFLSRFKALCINATAIFPSYMHEFQCHP